MSEGADPEAELLAALAEHDDLVRRCVRGELTFGQFAEAYNNFYLSAALDGHESDSAGRALLRKHAMRIRLHRIITEEILASVCSDKDAVREAYKRADRFGSAEAVARLSLLDFPPV
jgi:hypothetical protein